MKKTIDPETEASCEGWKEGYKAGIKEVLRLSIASDILCSEKTAEKNNCVACKRFYRKLKKGGFV